MDQAYEHKYYRIERKHAWSVGRRGLVASMLRQLGVAEEARILDVGCGGGLLVEELVARGFTGAKGIDAAAAAVTAAHSQGITTVSQGDGTSTGFEDDSFDVVIASDVLEHILNESEALNEWQRIVRPGGHVLIFVPAFSFLWSEHDVVNQHFRRYSRSQLQSVILGAGFDLIRIGYWNTALFTPTLLARRAMRFIPGRSEEDQGDQFLELNPIVNRLITGLLLTENRIIKAGVNPPIGVSVYAVCRVS